MNSFYVDEKNQVQTSDIYNKVQKGIEYLNSIGLIRKIPLYIDFYEGKHWSEKISRDTKHIPRITINVFRNLIDSKVTNILSKKYKVNYRCDNTRINTEKFNTFAEYNFKNMKQEKLDYEAVKSGVLKGTYILYYYWDEKHIGPNGTYEGAINGAVLDPLKVYFADPTERDVQRQDYIIFSKRESIKRVRDLCQEKGLRSHIVPDDYYDTPNNTDEVNDNDLVTLYTYFFRINDEVHFQYATKYVCLGDPTPLNPNVSYDKLKEDALKKKEAVELDGESKDSILTDGKKLGVQAGKPKKSKISSKGKCIYYPIEVGSFIERENSIYGISEGEDIIEAQKAINFLTTYAIMSSQKQGIPKLVVKKDALKGQIPNNSIDQYLVDNTPNGVEGIKYLNTVPYSSGATQLAPTLYQTLKDVINANDIVTSDMVSKEMTATAISLLTSNADRITDVTRKKYWRSIENVAHIIEQFQKLYYLKPTEFVLEADEKTKRAFQEQDMEQYRIASENGIPYTPTKFSGVMKDTFQSSEFADAQFLLIIDVGEGTQFSEAQSMYMLNNMLQNKMIDQKVYIKLYPATGMSFKNEMLNYIEEREQEEVVQLRNKNQELTSQVQQLSNYIKQLETAKKELVSMLNDSNNNIKSMRNEYATKINKVRDYLASQNQAEGNASKFAKEQNKGISSQEGIKA